MARFVQVPPERDHKLTRQPLQPDGLHLPPLLPTSLNLHPPPTFQTQHRAHLLLIHLALLHVGATGHGKRIGSLVVGLRGDLWAGRWWEGKKHAVDCL